MATSGFKNIVTDGLVLSLDAANTKSYPGTGTTWANLSSDQSNSTLVGSPTFTTEKGGIFSLNGTSQYFNLGSSTSLNYLSGDFCIDCWVYYNGTHFQTGANIIGNYFTGSVGSAGDWQLLIVKTTNTLTFYGTTGGYIITNVPITRNVWTNINVSRVSGVIKMYINGVERASANNSTNFTRVGGNLNIGIDGNNIEEPFGGSISTLRLYNNKGLSATEVLQNYNATKGRFV